IAILVDDRLIVLVEHQSTINENMPLRLLEYVSRIYEQLVPSEDRYEKKMIKIPYPEFYVFYNGTEEYPVEKELRLSDAFLIPEDKYASDKKISLEILVKVININIDKENPILKRCRALQEYSTLIELIRETKRQNPKAPLEETVSKAITDGIVSDYLKRKSKEVRNMLIAEYSYETDIKVQRREAFRLGKEEGAEQTKIETAKNMILDKIPLEQIEKWIGLPFETIKRIADEMA
ncbi:MAG: Rpn family recombination-promoting nuclease/putative transposase, partial [Treponema sp.]|nr:Rpn family recombination-promoting nuclease/putative transposase [Treponema sp.]